MVLISIRPFALWRAFILGLVVIGLSLATTFGQDVLLRVDKTPYDHQMERVQPVLISAALSSRHDLTLSRVNEWIRELRQIPYAYSMQWKTPSELTTEPAADCKGKAVALYRTMRDHGAVNVRLVIGKRAPTSRVTHTWVEWTTASGCYVLDPTINWSAASVAALASEAYVPYYAYAGARKYRAVGSSGLIARL